MPLPGRLYKTTIVIWSRYDGSEAELHDLAYQAEEGDAYCTRQDSELVTDPSGFPDTEFFGVDDGKGEDEAIPRVTARPEDAIDSVLKAVGASDEASQRIRRTLGG